MCLPCLLSLRSLHRECPLHLLCVRPHPSFRLGLTPLPYEVFKRLQPPAIYFFNKFIKVRTHSLRITETSHTHTHTLTVCTISMNYTIFQARNLVVILSLPFISPTPLPTTKLDQASSEISVESDHSYLSPVHHPLHQLPPLVWSLSNLSCPNLPFQHIIHNVIKVVLIKCTSDHVTFPDKNFQ